MTKKIETPDFLLQLMANSVLEINWPVSVELGEDDDILIFTDPEMKCHTIRADQRRFDEPIVFLPGWVHELCHAVLAEKIDVQFSCPKLSKLHFEGDSLDLEEVSIFQDCWQLVDIWVDDLLVTVDPELKAQDLQLFFNALNHLFEVRDFEQLREYRAILGIAHALAECKRHGLDPGPFQYFASLYPPGTESSYIIGATFELLRSLLPLSYDRDQDLLMLESAVSDLAEIIGRGRRPRLIEEEGNSVWLLERV